MPGLNDALRAECGKSPVEEDACERLGVLAHLVGGAQGLALVDQGLAQRNELAHQSFGKRAALGGAASVAAWIFVAAVVGKLLGIGLPALLVRDARGALLLGLSMVPRAEIAMIVIHHGHRLGDDVVSAELYSAMVLVSVLTCLVAPLGLRPLLERWPQTADDGAERAAD